MVTMGSFCARYMFGAACLLLLISSGCANRDGAASSFTHENPPLSLGGNVTAPDHWWVAFNDSELNQQVERAFGGSFTLAVAAERITAARALARREASDLFPDVNGVANINSALGPGSDSINFTTGLDASYQVDLWGQIESRIHAERLRADATHADYQAVALSLAADITRTWFALIEAQAQLKLLDIQIETNQTGAKLQEARFGLGLIRSPDVLRQRQLVESTREQVVIVRSRIETLEHQLAILLGEPPQNASFSVGDELPGLPPLPSTGLPSELLCRRPDVRREYLALLASDYDLASAITSQYPRINLTASLLNTSERPEDLFRDWFLSIGGQLVAPLVDGGQRRAEVDRTKALTRLRFNEYSETMLNAFREVEDALALERYQIKRIERLEAQSKLAKQSAVQLREQYLIGDADYLDVLSAITAEQRLQRDTLTARLDLLLIRVSLYLALAGGFEPQQYSVSAHGMMIEADAPRDDREVNSMPTSPVVADSMDGAHGDDDLNPLLDEQKSSEISLDSLQLNDQDPVQSSDD